LKRIHRPTYIKLINKGNPSPSLQQLFSKEETLDEESQTCDDLAKQVVDSLLSTCLEAFPDLFKSFDLPTSMGRIERITPYELAVAIFNRWSTEKDLLDELDEHTKLVLSEQPQGYIRFCIQAMLNWFNLLVNPKYRRLFVSTGLTD